MNSNIDVLLHCYDPFSTFSLENLDTRQSRKRQKHLSSEKSSVSLKEVTGTNEYSLALHDITYNHITKHVKEDCEKLSEAFALDKFELIRVAAQLEKLVNCSQDEFGYNFEKSDNNNKETDTKEKESGNVNNTENGKTSKETAKPTFGRVESSIGKSEKEKKLQTERMQLYTRKIFTERRNIVKLVNYLIKLGLDANINDDDDDDDNNSRDDSSDNKNDEMLKAIIAKKYAIEILTKENITYYCFLAIIHLTDMLNENAIISNKLVFSETYLFIIELLKLTITLIINTPSSSNSVADWFNTMNSISFGSLIPQQSIPKESLITINSLLSIASLTILDLEQDFSDLESDSFLNNPDDFNFINKCITSNLSSPLITFAWSFIIHRKSIILYENRSQDTQFRSTGITDLGAIASRLANHSLSNDVYTVIGRCHDTLSFDSIYTTVLASLLAASLPYVSLTTSISDTIANVVTDGPDAMVSHFLLEPFTKRALLLSKSKVPIAFQPFLKLLKIDADLAVNELNNMNSFMRQLPSYFTDYETSDDDPEVIVLQSDLCVFNPREDDHDGAIIVPQGTRGKIMPSETKSAITIWFYEYNGWILLGRILENFTLGENVDESLVVDILEVISNVLKVGETRPIEFTSEVLTLCSKLLAMGTGDIVDIVLRILDESLQCRKVNLAIASLQFFTALTPLYPHRVWPYLSRSGLLERNGRGGFAESILAAVEIVNGDFGFTLTLIELIDKLVDDCIANAANFDNFSRVSVTLKSEVLYKFVVHLVQVFESFMYWRFLTQPYQLQKIGTKVLQLFEKIIITSFGIDGQKKLNQRPFKVFATSATLLVNVFLEPNIPEVRSAEPLLSAIDNIAKSLLTFQTGDMSGIWSLRWLNSILNFISKMIRVRSLSNLPPSSLEKRIYSKAPQLIMIYIGYADLRVPIFELLENLVSASWPYEPPSLLAHLGSFHSQVLLTVLSSTVKNTLLDESLKLLLYGFFAALVESKQEGLSILLVSGRDIRKSRNDKIQHDNSSNGNDNTSILKLLEKSANISKLNVRVASKLLDAISLAHNTWTSKFDNSDFIRSILDNFDYICNFDEPNPSDPITEDETIEISYKYYIAAKTAEICALQLHKGLNSSEVKPILSFLMNNGGKLLALSRKFLNITGYRASLHANLHRNFENQWKGFNLIQFSRTSLFKKEYNHGFVYDLGLMNHVFESDPNWEDYREEIREANLNLLYTSVQLKAAKAWGALISTLCTTVIQKKDKSSGDSLQLLATIAKLCLRFNTENGIPVPLFKDVFDERLQLSFFLYYNISRSLLPVDSKAGLVEATALLVSTDLNYLESLRKGDTRVCRFLLRIIIILLDSLQKDSKVAFQGGSGGCLSDLVETVVAKGIKTLVTTIENKSHINSSSTIQINGNAQISSDDNGVGITSFFTEDLTQIISVLTKVLTLNPSRGFLSSMATMISETHTAISIMTLFSCSHQLAINGDPVFGELSLLLILELASVDIIAEHLIVNGLFSMLVESPIATMIQQGGIKPTSSNPAARLHSIWCRMLTLVASLLSKIGSRLIPEIAMFLKFYSNQIEYALKGWNRDNLILSISTVVETSQIVILIELLSVLDNQTGGGEYTGQVFIDSKIKEVASRENSSLHLPSSNGSRKGFDGQSQPQHNGATLPSGHINYNKQDLADRLDYLLTHPKFLASRVVSNNAEEAKLSEQETKDGSNALVDRIVEEVRDIRSMLDTQSS